ncbi:MAG: hypothetical protein AB1768_10605 [Pseudomonadota bacterium]|jgi:hypothetical protein
MNATIPSDPGAARPNAAAWSADPAAWRFLLVRYAPTLAVLNLAWELMQLPLYALWHEALPRTIAYAVLHCTAGDVLIGMLALLTALVATRAGAYRRWHWQRIGVITVVLGIAYTAFSEWRNALLLGHWTYTPAMPVLPLVPIGVAPLLQWTLVPPAALGLARRRAEPAVGPAAPHVNDNGEQS